MMRILIVLYAFVCVASAKYNQRIFVDVPGAISFADPLKSGFRVVLGDRFVESELAAANLPTIFVTAIPLHQDEHRFTSVLYAEKVTVDKQVKIGGLREHSWYYVCIEWESINRHNESTGASCKLYQTLDRFGKTSDSVVTDLEITAITDMSLQFRVRSEADFPLRLTAYMKGGQLNPAAQVFYVTSPISVDVTFPFLRPDTNYGQLCVLEEPLVAAYTAMGRLVYGLKREKCYFDQLSTQPAHVESSLREPLGPNELRAMQHTQMQLNAAARNNAGLLALVNLVWMAIALR